MSCDEYSKHTNRDEPYFDPERKSCWSSCPDTNKIPDENGICRTCEELDPNSHLDSTSKKCVAHYIYKDADATSCNDWLKPLSGSVCVESCGDNQEEVKGRCKCVSGF